jgi:plasmid replication initiation protein
MNKSYIKDNQFVVKYNDLIEARYRLSLQESHVILWLLTQIKPDDAEFEEHTLNVVDFAKIAGLRVDGLYDELQQVTERLMKRTLKIRNPENQHLLQVSWLSSALYKHTEGCVILCFDPKLKPYLLQLKGHFTKINITDSLKFKSIYAVRIYELLAQYSPIGKRETTIDELREWCGIDEKEYKLYKHFKARVINRAKNEINAKTHYSVDYREIKKSRKVDRLEWVINLDKNTEPSETANSPEKITFIPINYAACAIPEIVEFCKAHEVNLGRVLIDALLQVIAFDQSRTTLALRFASTFFRDRCDTESVANTLKVHFAVQNIEFI